ncbi:MAG: sigma factor-like helix-turn-helix DNA-binding protein [Bryobacteraceae bacterium]
MVQPVHHFDAMALPQLTDLFQSANALLPSEASACDVVRATYREAVTNRDGVAFDRTKLFSILLRNVRRKRKDWQLLAGRAGKSAAGNDSGEGLLAMMRSMPLDEAEVVLLRDVQEFTMEEIQRMLGGRIDSIHELLKRGRTRLIGDLAYENLPLTAAKHSSRGFALPG